MERGNFYERLLDYAASKIPSEVIKRSPTYRAKAAASQKIVMHRINDRARIQVLEKTLAAEEEKRNELANEFRQSLTDMENVYARAERRVIEKLEYTENQLQLAKGIVAHSRQRVQALHSQGLAHIYEIFDEEPALHTVAGLVLDNEFKPIKATRGFRSLIGLGETNIEDITIPRMLSHLDFASKRKVLTYAANPSTEPFSITLKDEKGREHEVELTPKRFVDGNGELVGTFLRFVDKEPGWLEKLIASLPSRKNTRELAQQLVTSITERYTGWLEAHTIAQQQPSL
jgi:hypothetical protein